MLSRIAESLFWIGRYVERADMTARILDVHLQLLLEDPWVDESTACRSLLSVMGAADVQPDRPITRADVLRYMTVDRTQPGSIAFSVNAARENARRAREIVSSELWECMNATYTRMPFSVRQERAHELFAWVRERSALAGGIVDSVLARDEAYSFFLLGRMLERADMTARLLATRDLTDAAGASWTTILRSCGAYEAYLRAYHGMPSATNSAEFLLVDRELPRSIGYAIATAIDCLDELHPSDGRRDRHSPAGRAQRRLELLLGELDYRPIPDTLDNLSEHMEEVQTAILRASEEIHTQFFPESGAPGWANTQLQSQSQSQSQGQSQSKTQSGGVA
ncbi:alpha-E domain-containing protein [Gulosibacter macacae]|uniref:Alpha-E domain-containing protein n=1 Tax=Gulosibacter macacae TaxID=2488791 RepID=A0A3P3VUH3_9MICO|nr:alpha-E domain-containing protein [Gulosibacter macacae]RRJ85967.1 alpha-E domain-containing protein [Gulosibacter macacae]